MMDTLGRAGLGHPPHHGALGGRRRDRHRPYPLAQGADVETAACGGEDYKLLLTADTAAADRLAADFRARFGTPLHPVGHITDSDKLEWLENGRPRALDWHGFTHY